MTPLLVEKLSVDLCMNFDRILNCFHFSEKRKLQKKKIVTGRVHKPGGAGEESSTEAHHHLPWPPTVPRPYPLPRSRTAQLHKHSTEQS
jgi:hypothetical protein